MTIADLLQDRLTTHPGVAARVGMRVYPLKLPQHPTYDAVTYQRIDSTPQNGTSNRRESRWQINCWSRTPLAAHGLAREVKDAFEEWHYVLADPGIAFARVVNELDDYEDETKSFRSIVDVMLTTFGD